MRLELAFLDLASDWTHAQTLDATLLPNQSTELLSLRVPGPPPPSAHAVDPSHSVVASARLVDPASGEVLARYADWPQPFRLLELRDPQVEVQVDASTEPAIVRVRAALPVKGVFFTVDESDEGALGRDEAVRWSDNALDVIPGDERELKVWGLNGKKAAVRMAYLGCEKGRVVYENNK